MDVMDHLYTTLTGLKKCNDWTSLSFLPFSFLVTFLGRFNKKLMSGESRGVLYYKRSYF